MIFFSFIDFFVRRLNLGFICAPANRGSFIVLGGFGEGRNILVVGCFVWYENVWGCLLGQQADQKSWLASELVDRRD